MSGALSHIRILDLSRILAGPWATQILADLGAEVIKVERPGTGDETRGWGPPFLMDAQGRDTHNSAYFLSANRGKKSITVDISTAEGQDIIKRLAAISDVVVENYKVDTLDRYGLGYRQLFEVNSRLVYCSITGFGQAGPYAHRPGYDYIFQGMGGLMSITGKPDDEPGGGPVKVGVAVADIFTGMYATTSILAALEHRHISGRGQHIDLALMDCVVGLNSFQALNYFLSGKTPVRLGNEHPNMVPYSVFECADDHIIVAVGNDSQFKSFCKAVERPDIAADTRFTTVALRLTNRDALMPMVEEILKGKSRNAWMDVFERANVPCGPINTIPQAFEDPQVLHRGMKVELPNPIRSDVPGIASPIRLSDTPVTYNNAPPILGQHTDEVLAELLSADDQAIAKLRLAKII